MDRQVVPADCNGKLFDERAGLYGGNLQQGESRLFESCMFTKVTDGGSTEVFFKIPERLTLSGTLQRYAKQ